MGKTRRRLLIGLGVATGAAALALPSMRRRLRSLSAEGRVSAARDSSAASLDAALAALGTKRGTPLFIRIFKREAVLELWVELEPGAPYRRLRRYPICTFSGELGPKTREGDRQAPEGLYRVAREQMNPNGRFHLSFNLGYPNAFERAQGWTGSALMVHGECVSIGCYAMGNPAIEEIYTLMEEAFDAGQVAVPVHAFPFALDAPRWPDASAEQAAHWSRLRPAYLAFAHTQRPPKVEVTPSGYTVL